MIQPTFVIFKLYKDTFRIFKLIEYSLPLQQKAIHLKLYIIAEVI